MFCARSRLRSPRRPHAAARLIGGRALRSESIDIGVAVEAQDGIMVPVIRNADKTSLADLTSRYTELVDLARRRRVTRGDDRPAGSLPFQISAPSVSIGERRFPCPIKRCSLGLGAGKKAPTWSEEKQQFVPTTQAELTLSFDHRSLDGGGAGRLLKRITELLSRPGEACRTRLAASGSPEPPAAALCLLFLVRQDGKRRCVPPKRSLNSTETSSSKQ